MEEIEFASSFLAWFLLCIAIGVLEIKLISVYEKKEMETLKILFEKINNIMKISKKMEFSLRLPRIGIEVIKIEKLNESSVQMSAPFCENITVIFDGGANISLNEQEIVFYKKF